MTTLLRKFVMIGCFSGLFAGNLDAQLTVVQGAAMGLTPAQLVQNYLIGAGVTISNVTYNGSSSVITSDQVGTFATAGTATTQLGLAGGILMTSGKASIAIGPNNAGGAGSQVGGPGDPDLNMLSGSSTFDKAIIEFDFIPQFDTIRFRYVFGSEEFFEYCNQFNDAFGFFLSGPGINGTFSNNSVNIARMPGSINNYVTINNICANTASRWTNTNGQYYQYDGLTYVYSAWYVVQPCTTYHIKLAIGDAVDKQYDSGVFLEQNSFSSPGVNMVNNNTIPLLNNKAVEGCNDVRVNFRLMATLDYPYRVDFTIGGNATNGVDYTHIENFVVFPPGTDSVNVIIHPIQDGITEGVESVIFTLNQVGCDGQIKRDTVLLDDYNPMSIEPNSDTSLCFGGQIVLKANTTGGIMPLYYQWNLPGNDSIQTFIPPVGSNVYTVKVTDICSKSVYDTSHVTVHPVPVANAGTNTTIPNGTSTTLHGSASGGYGLYQYAWASNPPGFSASVAEPSTGNMSTSMIYILQVTDQMSSCISEPSQVMIIVQGGPLSVNPVSDPDSICYGDTTRLFALAGGGSGLYTYQWSSNPPGFTSSQMNPVASPQQSTSYQVIVNDGFNQRTGSTAVIVNSLPVIHLGPSDTSVCIFDSVVLDAGNPGATYKWSDGTTSRRLTFSSTGIGFDVQTYTVTVTDRFGCENSGTITVAFTFDACVGINELQAGKDFIIAPNPADKYCRITMINQQIREIKIITLQGITVFREIFAGLKPDQYDINLDGIKRGLYLLKIQSGSKTGVVKLMVI